MGSKSFLKKVALSLVVASGQDKISLVTFDGAKETTHSWRETNDPVMGGKSVGTFKVEDGVGVFDGECAIVPALKAPGFINAGTVDKTAFPDISSCNAIELQVKSTTAYKGYRLSFSNAHPAGGSYFAYGFKSRFDVPTASDFTAVTIPFSNFSDLWDGATGEPIKTCQEDKKYCPDQKTLKNIETVRVWAEGVEGKVHLELQSISAVGCKAVGELSDTSSDVYDFSKASSEKVQWYEVPDPVMGGKSSGNFTIMKDGFGRFQASVVDVPVLKAPGFVKIITCAQEVSKYGVCSGEKPFLDVSTFSQFRLRARSSSPTYAGFKLAFGPGKSLFSTGFKQDFKVGEQWTEVVLPFNKFSSATSPATGEPTKRCEDDKSVCPDAKTLGGITELAIWAEGIAAEVNLDIAWIKAEKQSNSIVIV
jgi:hypothetical protein